MKIAAFILAILITITWIFAIYFLGNLWIVPSVVLLISLLKLIGILGTCLTEISQVDDVIEALDKKTKF